ncbi:PREDICTED: NAC domain-containing protein 68-like [Nicotiana attenuata]|uniref:NAC domain-containing protein 68-like n=1 Tax=Nicotiana attenuata TaxID=49451 RepID=UPI0009055D4C|nr:PREDICTED: NAC domain-containing protein 68-like [Nicotiana attenuata]
MLPEAKLPTGFRFHPTDVELINSLERYVHRGILPPDGDIEVAKIGHGKFLEIQIQRRKHRFKNSTKKFSRTVGRGTWKDQSGGAPIKHGSKNIIVGFRRSLKYKSNIVKEQNDKWLMQEYILAEDYFKESNEDIIVLCKIKNKKMNEKKVDGNEIMEEEVDELVTSLSGTSENQEFEAYGQRQANYLAAGVEQDIYYQYADYSNDWFLSMINFEELREQDLGMQIDKPIK